MIKILEVKVPIDFSKRSQQTAIASFLGVNEKDIKDFKLIKKSIDARNKSNIVYSCNFAVDVDEKLVKNKKYLSYEPPKRLEVKKLKSPLKVVVVGSGPSGLFAALTLAKSGAKVVVVEKGESMAKRIKSVETYLKTGKLSPKSNIQEGEGGAGTFSDGKLNTGISSPYIFEVLSTFYENGSDESVLYDSRPHVGTDVIRKVVVSIRKQIEKLGGEFMFETEFVGYKREKGLIALMVQGENKIELPCDKLVLGLGYSARKTHRMLYEKGMAYKQKPFSVGYRIEHLQSDINKSQYGKDIKGLPPAEYKLFTHLPDGRGVYTFCMCPGGEVVSAVSGEGEIVTNGMSFSSRNGKNANSALLVSVDPSDYGSADALAGMDYQERLEKEAYEKGKGNFIVTTIKDFLDGKESHELGRVKPTIRPKYYLSDVSKLLDKKLVDDIKLGIIEFKKKIKCFDDGILTGIETRSSAPFMVERDEDLMTSEKDIYMIGEGAGMAGGIVSSAVDGIKIALKIIEKAKENEPN